MRDYQFIERNMQTLADQKSYIWEMVPENG